MTLIIFLLALAAVLFHFEIQRCKYIGHSMRPPTNPPCPLSTCEENQPKESK
jgi:hypothetical protein